MKKLLLRNGLVLLFLGMVLLGIGIPTHFCDHNAYLVLCVLLMLAGLVLYVRDQKRKGKY